MFRGHEPPTRLDRSKQHHETQTHHVGHEGDADEQDEDAPGEAALGQEGVGRVNHGLTEVVGVARDREKARRDEPCCFDCLDMWAGKRAQRFRQRCQFLGGG